VIGIDPIKQSGWVHVRERTNEHDTWSACNEWGDYKQCWYPLQVSLKRVEYQHPLTPPGRHFIGIDIGASKIACVLLDSSKRDVTHRLEDRPTPTREPDLFEEVSKIISEAWSEDMNIPIHGIGIGLPGMVDPREGRLVQAPNLVLDNIKFVDCLKSVIRRSGRSDISKVLAEVPIHIDNDVTCATRGYFHKNQENRNFVCIFVGNGAGSGIVVDGKLLYGSTFSAGEVGHSTIDPKQYKGITPCGCGLPGQHWEMFVSNRGMVNLAEYLGKKEEHEASYDDFINAYQDEEHKKKYRGSLSRKMKHDNDPRLDREVIIFGLCDAFYAEQKFAVEVVKEDLEFLAIGIANYMNILNPEEIILGGGMIRGFFGDQHSKPLGMSPKTYLHKLIPKYAVRSVSAAPVDDMVVYTEEEKRDLASLGAALIFKDESYFEYINAKSKLEHRESR
jgi:glucokinase